ncbi:unnamed protein product [Absidia cylindrospora]
MKIYYLYFFFILFFIIEVFAKGGGGGGGGGSGGGRSSRGGSSSRSGSSSSRGKSGGGGAPSTSKGPGRSISADGSTGSFKRPPSYSSSLSRQTFNYYNPTYKGAYGTGRYSGYYGTRHSGIPYFFVLPSFLFIGYYGAYHRYNSQGAYYAPEMSSQGSGSTNILINGTTYSSHYDNFHYTINATARSDQFATIDMAYFGSSDLNAHPADFIYRLTLAHAVEFDDINSNGLYDAQEPILSITSLQRTSWQPMVLSNRTVPTNTSQTYLETVTTANVTYNNTDPASANRPNQPVFGISLTLRSSNLQLNGTASIPLQPNSIQYDVQLQNYPAIASGSRGGGVINPRTALAQVITTKPYNNMVMDVNATTPLNIAQQIKTNITYGASIGNYSEGRLEYQPTANITNMAGISTSTWTNLMDPAQVNRMNAPNTWGWGDVAVDARTNTMVLVTLTGNDNANGSNTTPGLSSYRLSGLAYLDTDIINSAINHGIPSGTASSSKGSKLAIGGVTTLSAAVLLVLALYQI